jgi:alpha-mannosidase
MKSCGYGDYILLNEDETLWDLYNTGERWGGKDLHFWFKTRIEIPKSYEGKTVIYEVKTGREGSWDAINPQFLAYVNNKPVQGLDVNHREILLCDSAIAGEVYEIALYAYSGMTEGLVELNSSISILNKDVEKLYYNIKVPTEIAELLSNEDKRRFDILNYMTEVVNMLDLRKAFNEEFNRSILEANAYLENEFYNKYCGEEDIIELCVGHTHIDVAWLWTLAQTREKTARSFSTVLNLMKQYPQYVFMSSQPQLYQYIKEDHPEIYNEIKKMVAEGRWEPDGAMWLEADCNLTSGESLVRQIIYGKRFFKEEFGVDSKMLWLPDVFGYSAALPQILKKSGIDYFMTTKISWNEYNKMPYDTFLWKGMDGSVVLTHFISTRSYEKNPEKIGWTTYNGEISPNQVMGCWQRYQHKDLTNEVLNCFGYGDGGGGATKEMLENAIRLEKGIPGCPKVKIGKAIDFFKRMDSKIRNNRKLPKWVGELYLEYHRGTYTSIARNKKYNRKTEFLNIDAELFSTINSKLDSNSGYPQEKLNDCWRTTLLNQFHDIIPGSSIKEVYEDSKRDYERINKIGNTIIEASTNNISSRLKLLTTSVVVFNQLSFGRSDIVSFKLPENWIGVSVYDGETLLESQETYDGNIIFYASEVPSKGYKAFSLKPSERKLNEEKLNTKVLENNFYRLEFDENYNLASVFDKVNIREVIKPGEKGNVLQAFEDKPHNFDAWDINIYYQEKMWEINDLEKAELIETGPVRTVLEIRRRFLDSTIVQKICLYNKMGRIDFKTWIDWKEKQILMKAAFPVDIHSDKATYEIQYGNVERPTHWNTSWDYARFEVCAHKWADLSEGGYGVSIINDCKYGHDIKDSNMRLTLIKSAAEPNIDADREIHEFTYALYPHNNDWKEGKVVPMAYNLNCPMFSKVEKAHDGDLPQEFSFIKIDKSNVIIEVVKKAEIGEETIIRLYECHNRRDKVKCSIYKNISKVYECDLLENEIKEVKVSDNCFDFEIKPYEIKTFKLKF